MTTMMLANSTTLAFRQSIEKSPRSKYSILEQNCAIAVPEIPANSRVVEEKKPRACGALAYTGCSCFKSSNGFGV